MCEGRVPDQRMSEHKETLRMAGEEHWGMSSPRSLPLQDKANKDFQRHKHSHIYIFRKHPNNNFKMVDYQITTMVAPE